MNTAIIRVIATALAAPSAVPAQARESDIAVYGAVPCGIAASIAAAREGANVILIEHGAGQRLGSWRHRVKPKGL
jgi:ribulose 1,5-bisphosphate synthetase/thiazole synthase